jgi:hypothetical protein
MMVSRATATLLFLLSLIHGCSTSASRPSAGNRSGPPPQVLAVYEAWFGHPKHISVGYSSHDPDVLRKQIRQAKALGISGFVVDWYGYRQPFIDRSYALMQTIAAEENFRVAMMYDESDDEDGATDESIEDFKLFPKSENGSNRHCSSTNFRPENSRPPWTATTHGSTPSSEAMAAIGVNSI